MTSPYVIEGPALISFSGGRTSGYMLRQILNAGLRPDVHVVFANTGKERPETLDFIHECQTRWSVPVRWVEFTRTDGPPAERIREVTWETASRDGEPFDALIAARVATSALPGPMNRYCSEMLKTRTKRNFAWSLGWEEWTDAIGMRADEQRRVASLRASNAKEKHECITPLVPSGVAVEDVMAFWKAQPFDLQLAPHEGNCDLCFLKASWKISRLCKDRPDLAAWWVEHEQKSGKRFRIDRPNFAEFVWDAEHQQEFSFGDTDLGTCACTD